MHGGDLCAHPSSIDQQNAILSVTEIAGRPVSCSLPRTFIASTLSKGIIHGVPIADKEDEILAALADQNVVHVKRLPVKGHPEILSETVILTFSSKFPDRVKIAAMIYRSLSLSDVENAGSLVTLPPDAAKPLSAAKNAVNPTLRNLSAPQNVSTATALPMTPTATPARSL